MARFAWRALELLGVIVVSSKALAVAILLELFIAYLLALLRVFLRQSQLSSQSLRPETGQFVACIAKASGQVVRQ